MNSTKVSKPRKRRAFTPEFKAEAVRLVRTPGRTVAQVARELDLTATCLGAWVKQADIDEKAPASTSSPTHRRSRSS